MAPPGDDDDDAGDDYDDDDGDYYLSGKCLNLPPRLLRTPNASLCAKVTD